MIWNSATLMTWGSFLTRTLSLVVVLPLVLNRLTTAEISLWYLFSIIIGLQLLADLGFTPTFSRVIAYGMGGSTEIDDFRDLKKNESNCQPNWAIIEKICSTMRHIYQRLNLISLTLLIIFGTWSLVKPISETANQTQAWIAWGVIIISSAINFQGNNYNSYLQGTNQIALLRRWEIVTSIGAILTSCIVLMIGGGLLGLVVANQIWIIINVLRNYWLCQIVENGHFKQFQDLGIDQEIIKYIWPSAWRTALGVFMGYGLTQASGIFYAQISSAENVASYLLALRLIEMVSVFSQAPFYSKLPLLAKLRSQGQISQQVKIAQKGMTISYWSYFIGFVIIGIFAHPLLRLIGSNAEFVPKLLWGVLGLGKFVERYGAMHIQLYSTTNHIIWHIANGITGLIYLGCSLLLFSFIGVYAFPVGILVSNVGFYSWYSASHSYKAFGLRFWNFEKKTMFFPLIGAILYCLINLK